MTNELNWNLHDIIPTDNFEKLYSQVETELLQYKTFKQDLNPGMSEEKFKKVLEFSEQFKEKLSRLSAYTSLILATDIKSQEARVFQSKIDNLSIKISEQTMYLSHWIKGLKVGNLEILDEKNASRLFNSIPDLSYSLFHSREAAKHTLSEKEEQLIHKKDTNGIEVISELYDLIVNDFNFLLKIKGKDSNGKEIVREIQIDNQEKVVSYVRSTKPEEREAAYKALFEPYKHNIDKLFMIYSAISKDWKIESEMRNYDSSISMRNFCNQIPDQVIKVLLNTCTKNINLYQEYFKIKAKMLGVNKLKRYDIYAPVTNNKEHFEFEEAQKIVFETFEEFSPNFAEKARSVISAKHLDSHPKKNKRSGAFCMSIVPDVLPYVLTNFDHKKRDVSTLAHELGHAVHDIYASNHYHSVTHAPLPLCETASTFAEMIVFEKLLSQAKNDEDKKSMLMDKLADSYATIIRQNYFIKFEIEAHEMLQKGVTEKELSEHYLSLLKEQFGDSVEVNDEFRYEWSYIPHIFHSPFYCYAYNFGELLSLALFAKYKKEGKDFLPKFEKILSAGGSQDPIKLLASVDIDITKEEFWQGGFEIIKGWLKELR